jgi:hypothetical protein
MNENMELIDNNTRMVPHETYHVISVGNFVTNQKKVKGSFVMTNEALILENILSERGKALVAGMFSLSDSALECVIDCPALVMIKMLEYLSPVVMAFCACVLGLNKRTPDILALLQLIVRHAKAIANKRDKHWTSMYAMS